MIPLASLSEAIGVLEAAAGALRQAIAEKESVGQIAEDVLSAALQVVLAGLIGGTAASVVVAVGKIAVDNSTPGVGANLGPGNGDPLGIQTGR